MQRGGGVRDRVPASGNVTIVSGRRAVTVRQSMAGCTLTIWADLHSVHLVLDGHCCASSRPGCFPRTWRSWLWAAPAPAEIQRRGCTPVVQAVEVDRKVRRDRHVFIDGGKYQAGAGPAGTTVTMRLDGHLMHAIADGALART